MSEERGSDAALRRLDAIGNFFLYPIIWVREKIVEPNRKDYPWYHRQFKRVPEIDTCYTDDSNCFYEANQQYIRDKMVDEQICEILRRRKDNCYVYEGRDAQEKCKELMADFHNAATDLFIKYGELGYNGNVVSAFMKQKHRLAWERRFGPVGSGKLTAAERELEEKKLKALRKQQEERDNEED